MSVAVPRELYLQKQQWAQSGWPLVSQPLFLVSSLKVPLPTEQNRFELLAGTA